MTNAGFLNVEFTGTAFEIGKTPCNEDDNFPTRAMNYANRMSTFRSRIQTTISIDTPLHLTLSPLQNLVFLMNSQISEVPSRALQPSLYAGQTVDQPPGFQVIRNLILKVLDVLRSAFVFHTRESIPKKGNIELFEPFRCFANKAGPLVSQPLPNGRAVLFCQFDQVLQ